MQTMLGAIWLVRLAFGQPVDCSAGSAVLVRDDTLQACARDQASALYARGLAEARAAYAVGGSPESLTILRSTIGALQALTPRSRQVDIAVNVLQAAAAAAQSERDEMALYLDQAVQIETIQLAAGEPGAPLVSAHEAAGDLWLRVYRFEDARRSYRLAIERVGPTARARLGLARAEARLRSGPAACPDAQATCP